MEDINNTIKYVIYCRKSTDESSGKQVQSIPDQIKACIKYAENNGLNIMRKPKDFSDFETEQDIIKEDNEIDINNRRTYQETRNLFIIKEQESAKTPGIRKKRKKLISLIKQGKINGLLSYSPDRQARNMLEGGELITLVDDTSLLVELKYTNFYFENTASGKMMLGIWFVFSKQYSDKLSEDTSRGMQSKMEAGKALGNYKHGYYFLPSGHHQVHSKFFELWKEAFHMKIYNNKSDEFIRNRLTKKGYIKETYNEEGKIIKTQPVKLKNMHIIRTDPFYYGLFIRGESQIDLREINPDYQPLISQEEHQILIEKYYENKGIKFTKETKEENKKIMPLPEGFVKTEDGYNFTFCLPNKKRLLKKLNKEKELKKTSKIELIDIIKPHQIRYRSLNKKSKYVNFDITYDKIENALIQFFNNIKIADKEYKIYCDFMQKGIEERQKKRDQETKTLQLQLNSTEGKLRKYITNNLSIKSNMSEKELNIYNNEVKRLESIIESIKVDIEKLKEKERNDILEFEALVNIMQNLGNKFKNLKSVQKQKIVQLWVLNIIIKDDLSVIIYVNPAIQEFFAGMGRMTGLEPATT